MDLKIFKFLVTVLICSRLTHQITTPEDRCQISESGFVCIDCFTKGTCLLNEDEETYSVIFESRCQNTPEQFYCDDTISDPQNFGSCSLLPASATDCSCLSSAQCITDVNNPAVVLHCEKDTPATDSPCLFSSLDLDTCSCASLEETCLFLDDPNDNCTSYFIKVDNQPLTPVTCAPGTCFNQTLCNCVKTPVMCPPDGCPFLDNQNGNCSSYYICSENGLVSVNCVAGLCFDQDSCGCVPSTSPSPISSSSVSPSTISSSTISPTNCSQDCPLIENPDGNCQSYFVCTGTGLTPLNCSDTLCFDQESCGCIPAKDMTTIPPTCPPGCPFLDDPNDNCQSYFVCGGSGLTAVNCTTNLCFDQESCGCVEKTSTVISSTTAVPPTTCPSGCPFVDDPNDPCSKFYICDGTNLVAHECPGSLCFSQTTCQCQ